MNRGRKVTWTDEELSTAVSSSQSWRQVAQALGVAASGNSWNAIRNRSSELSLSCEHFKGAFWREGTGGGRDQQRQRDAKKRWYEDNKQVYLERNRRQREKARRLYRQAKDAPCADCRLRYPYFVMDLDHRGDAPKEGNVSQMVSQGVPSKIENEIAKCDVVCANCHRFRTARRLGIYPIR